MDKKRIELLRENAYSVFIEYASRKYNHLMDELQLLRDKYATASETERPFIKSKAEDIKTEIEYFKNHLDIHSFS